MIETKQGILKGRSAPCFYHHLFISGYT